MRANLHRAALAVTALTTLLVPAVSSHASPRQELQENRRKLQRLREDIAAGSKEAKTLRADIDRLNRDITRLQMAINDLDADIGALKDRIQEAKARIERLREQIEKVEEVATAQAVELYKSGGLETIDALLDASSIAELNDRLQMMGVAATENTTELVRYSRLRAQEHEASRDLFAQQRRLQERRRERATARAELASRKRELAARLGRVRDQLAHDREDVAELVAANRALKAKIVEFQAQQAVASLGTSRQGFIWPLNGAVTSYYGQRWGRMHTGIDIDGYTGQPIVAAKEGVVITAGSMSGYGNTVVIDHGGGISTLYAHMSGFNTGSGASVRQGQVIGYVGCTGSCTGDHLHFEVRVNGNPVDPMPYLP